MDGISKILLFVIILFILSDIGTADSFTYDNNAFSGSPSYSIITFSDNPVVDQGDEISNSIFISGAGDVDYNKFIVSIPPYIVKNNIVNITYLSYFKQNDVVVRVPKNLQQKSPFTLILFNETFMADENVLDNIGESYFSDKDMGKRYPPINLDFTIDEHAPSGNHKISYILFYRNGSQWNMYETSMTIHIRYWYEKEIYYIPSMILIILSIMGLFMNGSKELYKLFLKIRK